jgi:DNA replication protein DnaC
LNTRYNDKRTTLITTNYPNQPSALLQAQSTSVTDRDVSRTTPTNAATRAMREETLGDRIGERMRSRLQEMCIVVPMHGDDFRQTVRRASFL